VALTAEYAWASLGTHSQEKDNPRVVAVKQEKTHVHTSKKIANTLNKKQKSNTALTVHTFLVKT
jgi:hypothetical protein